MAIEKEKIGDKPAAAGNFKIEGKVELEPGECKPGDLKLMVYAFDPLGRLLGSSELEAKRSFSMKVDLKKPSRVELIVGPPTDAKIIRSSSAYSQIFQAKDWIADGRHFGLKFEAAIPYEIWCPWQPVRICVSGHIRKVRSDGNICPVPYVKVEIFDVDREGCLWPLIYRWWDLLLDRRVVHIPEIVKERVNPPRIRPDKIKLEAVTPQPEPTKQAVNLDIKAMSLKEIQDTSAISAFEKSVATGFTRVGEAAALSEEVASRLDSLTLSSRVAPWIVFPWCFFSKSEVCETYTDCNGYFRCCFPWWPFHFRRGRLRFDSRPDIIIRVTQIIDGAETVIYMDPYTSTRWNVHHAHIDLFLDDERVRCGSGDCQDRPAGSPVFLTRIGDDEVYNINQTSGLYSGSYVEPSGAPSSGINVAYGGSLLIYAQFGDALSSGSPARYYRLSYARKTGTSTPPDSAFKPIPVPIEGLNDTRVDKVTFSNESHYLGPQDVGSQSGLFAIRDFTHYYWYNPDWIGTWRSGISEDDTGVYVLRLEVFDDAGNKLTSAMGVDYRDGTHAPTIPPTPLPSMTDHCDLVITLDNKRPEVDLIIPAVINDCGVILWSAVPPLDFNANVSQENGRLHSWGLYYKKGVIPGAIYLANATSSNGLPSTVNQIVSGNSMLTGLASTCAFALKIWAYAHVRDGRHFVYYKEDIKAIVIEKCP